MAESYLESPCPVCETEHQFRPRFDHTGPEDIGMLYIRCPTCNWKKELRYTTVELEKTRIIESDLMKQFAQQSEQYGQPTESLNRRLRAAMEKRREIQAKITDLVE